LDAILVVVVVDAALSEQVRDLESWHLYYHLTSSEHILQVQPRMQPFDVSYKPNIDCHPSNVFSMIGYDITITNATPPPPSNHVPPSSTDCITNYNANADLSLQDHERNKLNRSNNRRITPPISGDDVR